MSINGNTVSHATTAAGSVSAIWGGLTLNDYGVLIGIVIGFLGLVMRWHWEKKTYNLKKLEIETMIGESLDTQA